MRGPAKRRNISHRKAVYDSVPRTLALLSKRVRSLQPEKKYFLVSLAAAVGYSNANGSIWNACLPAIGSSAQNRLGDKIRVIGYEYNLNFTLNLNPVTGTNDSCVVRTILVDSADELFSNGSPATLEGEAFDLDVVAGTITQMTTSTRAFQSSARFARDDVTGMNISGGSSQRNWFLRRTGKLDRVIHFTPGTTTAAKGSVGIYIASTATTLTPATIKPYVNGCVKFIYTDC